MNIINTEVINALFTLSFRNKGLKAQNKFLKGAAGYYTAIKIYGDY